jgi:hypothetical protein
VGGRWDSAATRTDLDVRVEAKIRLGVWRINDEDEKKEEEEGEKSRGGETG